MKAMRVALMMAITVVLAGGTAWAQTAEEVAERIQAIDEQIAAARSAGAGRGVSQEVRDAVTATGEALRTAVAELPGVRDLDVQVETLMQQARSLRLQRDEVVRAHEAELAPLRNAVEKASKDMRLASTGGVDVHALLAERSALVRLQDAQQQAAKAAANNQAK